jgi:hypothetical protein
VEDQIEVVDHQVQHHGHVRPAGLKRRESLTLEIARSVEVWLRCPECAIVSLDVADLELEPVPVSGGDQPVGLAEAGREGLFHQHRDPGLERPKAHLDMSRCGNGNCHCLDPRQEIIYFHERRSSQLGGDFRGASRLDIADPDEADLS